MSGPYVPEEYWPARYRAQGELYVAKGAQRSSWRHQLAYGTDLLHGAFGDLVEGARVLDFGCGPGRFRPVVEGMGLRYTGVDLIPGLGTASVVDLEEGAFRGAFAFWVLQHITDPGEWARAVLNLHRWLEPGGTLLVVDHVPRPDMAPHMAPRGALALYETGDWEDFSILDWHLDHWAGAFRKPAGPGPPAS